MGACKSKHDIHPEKKEPAMPICGMIQEKDRKCRDVCCTILFLLFWVGMLVIAGVGIKEGEPYRLIYGSDYKANICGEGEFSNFPLVYYPRMNEDLLYAAQNDISPLDATLYGICVEKCPAVNTHICNYEAEAVVQQLPAESAKEIARKARAETAAFAAKDCWFVPLKSRSVYFRCLPTLSVNKTSIEKCLYPADSAEYYTVVNGISKPNEFCEVKEIQTITVREAPGQDNPLVDRLQEAGALFGRCLGDIEETYPLILAFGAAASFGLGIILLFGMNYFAKVMVYLICFGLLFASICFSFLLSVKAGYIRSDDLTYITNAIAEARMTSDGDTELPAALKVEEDRRVFFQVGAIMSYAFTFIFICILFFFGKKIKITVAMLKEASKGIQQFPFLLFTPIVSLLFVVALFVYWLVISTFIYSSGGISLADVADLAQETIGSNSTLNTTTIPIVGEDKLMKYALFYHFFGFLWTNQLIQAITYCTIAGTVCRYYWKIDETNDLQKGKVRCSILTRWSIMNSFRIAIRYHFGSLCLGSFLIAVIQFIRTICYYIDRQMKQIQDSNVLVKIVLKALQCCLYCFEKCLKFISKFTYILIAMKGKNFFSSSKETFQILLTNLAQIAIFSMVTKAFFVFCKLLITGLCGGMMYYYINQAPEYAIGGEKELASAMIPIATTCILSYMVASTFMHVFETTIDTILLCYCEDKQRNSESGNYYMSPELQKLMNKD